MTGWMRVLTEGLVAHIGHPGAFVWVHGTIKTYQDMLFGLGQGPANK